MSKSCNCPMHNSMVSICGMLKLTGLLLTIATVRGYQCHTNKKTESSNPCPPSPLILRNCITIPDIPHCSKRPVYIFHTWTILLSLKRKQKLFYSRNLNEIWMYPVSLFAQYFTFHNENCIFFRTLQLPLEPHLLIADTIFICLEFQKQVFPNNRYYAKALCCPDKLLHLDTCYSMLFDIQHHFLPLYIWRILIANFSSFSKLPSCSVYLLTSISPLLLLCLFHCFSVWFRKHDRCSVSNGLPTPRKHAALLNTLFDLLLPHSLLLSR